MLYRDYWVVGTNRLALALSSEHGDDRELGTLVPILAERFGVPNAGPIPSTQTPAKRYHTALGWLLLVFLVTPALAAAAALTIPRDRRAAAAFVVVVFAALMGTTLAFGTSPVYRYLHPFAYALAFSIGLFVEAALRARKRPSVGDADLAAVAAAP
jgi:hypothetical protein